MNTDRWYYRVFQSAPDLLTLPVRPEDELAPSSQQILAGRPDLETVVLPMLVQRLPWLSEAEIMMIAGIPREEILHTRAVQDWLAQGREQGRQEGEAAAAAPSATPPPPRSRCCRWSSWRHWRKPCSTSRAQPTWRAGWLPTPRPPPRPEPTPHLVSPRPNVRSAPEDLRPAACSPALASPAACPPGRGFARAYQPWLRGLAFSCF